MLKSHIPNHYAIVIVYVFKVVDYEYKFAVSINSFFIIPIKLRGSITFTLAPYFNSSIVISLVGWMNNSIGVPHQYL
jgi:hypothetical protein